ncbi:MAG: hypothetical protein ACTSQE_15935 [Candidatus Heimdallarchaeaceae archaeon]
MPVRIKKVNGYRVSHGGKVSAKRTTKAKAKRQANLLRGVAHGWKPTGKKARNVRRKKKRTKKRRKK